MFVLFKYDSNSNKYDLNKDKFIPLDKLLELGSFKIR